MSSRSFHVPILFITMMLFFVACNAGEAPLPPLYVQPVVDGGNNGRVAQLPITYLAAPSSVTEVNDPASGSSVGTSPLDGDVVSVVKPEGTSPGISIGSPVQHQVQVGEWLLQIARCYGADYRAVRQANPYIVTPNYILPGTLVAVPNVGSVGAVYGPPCVAEYTVIAGDTWIGLAERFGTTAVILQRVNPGLLWAGHKIIVPSYPTETVVVKPVVDPQPPEELTRITFAAGETAVTLNGYVAANSKTSYVFTAREAQSYKITLAPSQDGVTISLINPANAGQFLPTEGILPASGDYIIRVTGGAVDATFSLALSIVNTESGGGLTLPEAQRINFAPGATAATVSGSVAAGQVTRYVFTASEGQQLAINFIPSDAGITYMLTPPGLGSVMPTNNILPSTGDYSLVVIGGSVDATFTLMLAITNP